MPRSDSKNPPGRPGKKPGRVSRAPQGGNESSGAKVEGTGNTGNEEQGAPADKMAPVKKPERKVDRTSLETIPQWMNELSAQSTGNADKTMLETDIPQSVKELSPNPWGTSPRPC